VRHGIAGAGVGVALAVIGCFWQAWPIVVVGLSVPLGLMCAVAILWTGCSAVAAISKDAWGPLGVAGGWTVGALFVSMSRNAGDVVVPADWVGYGYLITGLIVVCRFSLRASVTSTMTTHAQETAQAPR
jgi:hypothetical protein